MERSLWLDPAMLALNLVDKSALELLGPLDWNQAAPAGFLLLSKWHGALFDYGEFSLTFLPWLFSVLALAGFLRLSVDVVELSWAPVAFVPFATSSTAVYYAGEFKQYSADLFVSVGLLLLTVRALGGRPARPWIIGWTVFSIAGLWLSHIAILVAAGTGVALLWQSWRQRAHVRDTVAGNLLVALHFVVLYWFQMRPAAGTDLFRYHGGAFARWKPSAGTLEWWADLATGYTQYPLGFEGSVWLPLLAMALGLSALARAETRTPASILLLPLLALFLASAAGRYPMTAGSHEVHSRFLLFTLPISLLLMGLGVRAATVRLARWLPVSHQRSGTAAAALGLAAALVLAQPSIRRIAAWPDFLQQEMRPLVAELRQERTADEVVYVYFAAVPAFRFYTRDQAIPFVAGEQNVSAADDMRKKLTAAEDRSRIFVVVAHDYSGVETQIIDLLRRHRYDVDRKAFPGAVLLAAEAPGNPKPATPRAADFVTEP